MLNKIFKKFRDELVNLADNFKEYISEKYEKNKDMIGSIKENIYDPFLKNIIDLFRKTKDSTKNFCVNSFNIFKNCFKESLLGIFINNIVKSLKEGFEIFKDEISKNISENFYNSYNDIKNIFLSDDEKLSTKISKSLFIIRDFAVATLSSSFNGYSKLFGNIFKNLISIFDNVENKTEDQKKFEEAKIGLNKDIKTEANKLRENVSPNISFVNQVLNTVTTATNLYMTR